MVGQPAHANPKRDLYRELAHEIAQPLINAQESPRLIFIVSNRQSRGSIRGTQAKCGCRAVSTLRLKRASPDMALYNDLGVSLLLSTLRL